MALLVQALTAMALAVPSVLAPVASADIGVAPTRVRLWAGMAFLSAMFAGLACGTLVGRYGPVRMFQAAAVCVALGLLAAPPEAWRCWSSRPCFAARRTDSSTRPARPFSRRPLRRVCAR